MSQGIEKFENFISLGCNCGVACALERYGLRSVRSPFDWCISDWMGIEKALSTEFEKFMKLENLRLEQKGQFRDIYYNIYFPHELLAGESLENKFVEIKYKFDKDIRGFYESIKKPTCFIRAIQNKEELIYLEENFTRIEAIIKKYNSENSILFLVQEVDFSESIRLPFVYKVANYSNEDCERNIMFEHNAGLVEYLHKVSLEEHRARNLQYSVKKIWNMHDKWWYRYRIMTMFDKADSKSLQRFLTVNHVNSIVIWGAGYIGSCVHEIVNLVGVEVKYYLDAYSTSNQQNNIPVYGVEPRELDVDMIVITPEWDIDFIKEKLREIYVNEPRYMGILEFLEECV